MFKKDDDSSAEVDSRPTSRSPEFRRLSRSPETRQLSTSPEPTKPNKSRQYHSPDSNDRTNEQHRSSRIYEHNSSQVNVTQKTSVEENEPKQHPPKIHATSRSMSSDVTSPTKRKSVDLPDSTADKRSYMNHTIASLEHIRRDSIEINKSNIRKTAPVDDEVDQVEINPRSSVKFGVELKRTNSQQSASRRKSSCSEIPHVEEIFELDLLERMLETVVGYEQRRRIRAQIRLVKKQIQDEEKTKNSKKTVNRSEVTTETFPRRQEASPTRKSSPMRKRNEDVSEYTSKYSKTSKVDRTTSPVRKGSPTRRYSPQSKPVDNDEYITSEHTTTTTTTKAEMSVRRSSPNRKVFIDGNSNAYRNEQANSYVQKSRSPSPKSNKISISSNLRNSEVKQINNSKSTDDDKPIWARKNILTKASDSTRSFTSSGKKTTVTKVQKQKTIEQNDDCVTSSYGIGPTDEDGKPLFGIRALKKKSPVVQASKG